MDARVRKAAVWLVLLAALLMAARIDLHRHQPENGATEPCAVCAHLAAPAVTPEPPSEAPSIREAHEPVPAPRESVRTYNPTFAEETRGPPPATHA
jgi:hypothetical protein